MFRRLIIVGASGAIGSILFEMARGRGFDVVGTFSSNKKKDLIKFDLLDQRITSVIPDIDRRDVVLLLGAAIDPEWVYRNQVLSNKINVEGTLRCINDAVENNARVYFMSSEAVFSKTCEAGYSEESQTQPLTTYARQKVEVESYLMGIKKACIIRTGRNIGWKQSDFYCPVKLSYEALLSGGAQMASDNMITLSDVKDTVNGILVAAEREITGTIHIVANPAIKRTEMAEKIIETSKFGRHMSFNSVKFSDLGFSEKRSRCAWLRNERARNNLGLKFSDPLDTVARKTMCLDSWIAQGQSSEEYEIKVLS